MSRHRDPQQEAPLEHTKGTGRCLCGCICGAPVDVCPKCHRKSLHSLPGGEQVCEYGASCADRPVVLGQQRGPAKGVCR